MKSYPLFGSWRVVLDDENEVDFPAVDTITVCKGTTLINMVYWRDEFTDFLYWSIGYPPGVTLSDLNARVSRLFPYVLAYNRVWKHDGTARHALHTDIVYSAMRYIPADLSSL